MAAPGEPEDPLIGAVLGGCRILRRLGRGGMGVVYLAHHARLDRDVAVKVLTEKLASKPEFIESFEREARSAARLEHPRIVQVYDAGASGKVHYIVMQFVDGETALDLISRDGRLSPVKAHKIIRAALEGLAEAHRRGIIHRDIKPSNILLGRDGSMRLSDFGLAAPVSGEAGKAVAGMGSPHYMSPEQLWGAPTDERSDIYSMGATYFHLLAGRPPFDGPTLDEIARMQVEDPAPDIRSLNREVSRINARIIARMLAKHAQARYTSVAEVEKDLGAPGLLIDELDEPSEPAPPPIDILKLSETPVPTSSTRWKTPPEARRFARPDEDLIAPPPETKPERPPRLWPWKPAAFVVFGLIVLRALPESQKLWNDAHRPPAETAAARAIEPPLPVPAPARPVPAKKRVKASSPARRLSVARRPAGPTAEPDRWLFYGTVVDILTLKPVAGATITFEQSYGRGNFDTVSEKTGEFRASLPMLIGSGYYLRVSHPEYRPHFLQADKENPLAEMSPTDRRNIAEREGRTVAPSSQYSPYAEGVLRVDLLLIPKGGD